MSSNYLQAVKPMKPEGEWGQWEGIELNMPCHHSLPVKPTGPDWKSGQWEGAQLNLLLTCCQVNRAKLDVRTVTRDTAGPGMKSLTSCQPNRPRLAMRTMTRGTSEYGMESLTCCQANRTILEVRTVRRDTAGPGMEPLTCYQANRTRLGVKTVRGHSWTWHGITHKLFSPHTQIQSEHSEKRQLNLACNHLLPVHPRGSDWKWEK